MTESFHTDCTMAVLWWSFLVLGFLSISEAQYNVKVNTCNMTLSEAPGVVTSPGFPSNYPDDTKCSLLIQAPEDHKVIFTFIEMDIEDHIDCRYDWVGLYDGPNDRFPSLGYFCRFSSSPVFSNSPKMTVKFSSDGSVNARGYEASFDFIQESEEGCNAIKTTAPGEVTSPNYPSDYPTSVECRIQIRAPEGNVVTLVFLEMSIEFEGGCSYDGVTVYDGGDDLAPDIGSFCGHEVPVGEFTSTNQEMTVIFYSDSSITMTGFKARYDFRDQEDVISSNNSSDFLSTTSPDESMKTFCHCDDVCHWFHDCCHGAQPLNNQTMNITVNLPALDLWSCTRIWLITNNSNYQTMVDYLLVSACPSWWSDDETRRLCENPDPDVVEVVHVHDGEDDGTPIFFRNLDCAICNEPTENSWSFHPYMDLWVCNESEDVFHNSSVRDIPSGIATEEDDHTLCGNLLESVEHLPSPRECISPNSIVKTCLTNDNSLNETVLELCQAEVGVVNVGDTFYWNEFCLKCNVDDNEFYLNTILWCLQPLEWEEGDIEEMFITLSPESHNGNNLLPPVFLSSNLVLGFTCPDGFSNEDGRCVPVPISWPSCISEKWNISYIYDISHEKISCYDMTETTERFVVVFSDHRIHRDIASDAIEEIYAPYNSQGYNAIKIHIHYWIDIEFAPRSDCSDLQFYFTEGCAFPHFEGDLHVCPFEEFLDDYNKFQPLRSGNLTLVLCDDRYIVPSFSRRTTILDVNGTSGLYSSRDVLTVCGVIHPFEDCLFRVIEPGTFVITSENKLIFDRLVFLPSDYTLQEDGSVKLCWSDGVSFFDFTNTQRLVANIAFGISSMCLFATLVIYWVFPSLRNIQGLIMIHFLITLIISQVVVEYGTSYLTAWPAVCQAMAIIGHFSFLSSFLWTNVLAWNLKCALVDALSKPNSDSNCRRMSFFYMYAIGLPALIVLGSVFVHFVSDEDTGPVILHYGGTRHCWIYPMTANIAVMLGPMAISLLVNFVLCVWIIVGFRRNMRQAESLRKTQSGQSSWTEALVYLKISFLLGFGWGFGFVAANTYHKSLWYVYIIINSLQGVLIFVAFGLNRRVRKLISDRSSTYAQSGSSRNVIVKGP